MIDLIKTVQNEVVRIIALIQETKAIFPNVKTNWIFYEIQISRANLAMREHDVVTLTEILPELKKT